MATMFRLLKISPETTVLDVGGTTDLWCLAPFLPRVVILNQPRASADVGSGPPMVFGDGLALPFADRSFDVVFSNSVIEHVGDSSAQQVFASEIARVGTSFWVQTPHRSFPVEQHLWMPVVHWLPRPAQERLLRRRITPWEWIAKPAPDERAYYVAHYCESVRLLGRRQMQQLFPGASILYERTAGWPKALIAYRTASLSRAERFVGTPRL
jgi:hypothetical protein